MLRTVKRGRVLVLLLLAALVTATSSAAVNAAEQKKPNAPKTREERAAAKAAQKAAPSPTISKKLGEIQKLLSENKIDQARKTVDDLEKRRNLKASDQANIFQFAAYVRNQQEQYEEAAKYFQKAVDLKALAPSTQKGMTIQLARIYGLLKRFDRALAAVDLWFEPIGEYQPPQTQVSEAHYLKGNILAQLKRPQEAVVEIQKALELATVMRESWLELLVAQYFQLEDFPKMAETLEKLLAHFPAKKKYYTTIAQIYAQLEKSDRALALLSIAREHKLLDKDREFLALSQHLISQDIPYQCGEVLAKAIDDKVLAGDAKNYGFLANCWLVAREQQRAMEPLEKGAEVAEDGSLYLRLAYLHLQRDRYKEAIPVLNKALAKAKAEERGSINLLLGVSYLGTKHLGEAERALKAALIDQKARPDAERYLTYLEQERQRLEPPAA
jgi:tetratricopeptide (TPR) repeat protein